jgi:hypothetical protein
MTVHGERNWSEERGSFRRRLAKVAVVALGVAAFGGAGLSGALAQDDSVADVFGSGGSGVFGEDLAESIIADVFASGGFDFDDDVFVVDVPTGGTGISGGSGDLNVGGNTGGSVTMGGGSSGGITIGGGVSGSGSGGGSGSGSGGGTGGGGGAGTGGGSGMGGY